MKAEGAFYLHLAEAIAVNRRRKGYYAARTGGRSRRLSNWLIGMEGGLLPFAWWIDQRARPFNRCGIPIVVQDFASMHDLLPPETPSAYHGRMTLRQRRHLQKILWRQRRVLWRHLLRSDFEAAHQAARGVLQGVADRERQWQVHLAMTKHLAESIVLSARHALDYAAQSKGQTAPLSKLMVGSQALVLPLAPRVDREAQGCHQLGIGILVNDLPEIR